MFPTVFALVLLGAAGPPEAVRPAPRQTYEGAI
jgi:hypothetical protein